MTTLNLHLDTARPSPTAQKTHSILTQHLQPSNSARPTAAAQQIDALAPMKRADPDTGADGKEKESPESFLWDVWRVFIAIAKQIPHTHDSQWKLVELVRALRGLEPTRVRIWDRDTRIWTDLPILSPAMREAWISPTYNNKTPTPERAAEWINLNSFAARLLTLESISWTLFAVWALRSALEEPSTGPKLDCDVGAAAEWILHSGEVLFGEVGTSETETESGETRALAGGELYHGKGGMFLERWAFWKRRFGEAYVQGDERGREAKQKMEDIERCAS